MGKFSEMDIEVQECVEDLKKLRGLAPYDQPSNIVYGDARFANSLKHKYSNEAYLEAERRLETECEKLTLRITSAQHELLSDLIIEERAGMSASRLYVVDNDIEEWDERYDALGELLQETINQSK